MKRLPVWLISSGIWLIMWAVPPVGSFGPTLGMIIGGGTTLAVHWMWEKIL